MTKLVSDCWADEVAENGSIVFATLIQPPDYGISFEKGSDSLDHKRHMATLGSCSDLSTHDQTYE
jgi:hypothetical protein